MSICPAQHRRSSGIQRPRSGKWRALLQLSPELIGQHVTAIHTRDGYIVHGPVTLYDLYMSVLLCFVTRLDRLHMSTEHMSNCFHT